MKKKQLYTSTTRKIRTKPKISRRSEITNGRAEINIIGPKKSIEKSIISRTGSWKKKWTNLYLDTASKKDKIIKT